MIYTSWSGRLQWAWFKNVPDLRCLLSRDYPEFVFTDLDDPGPPVPVFTYHSVEPEAFEADCRALVEGGYRALDPDEYLLTLRRGRAPRRSVLLTFDDGTRSLWAVAYPLMRRFGLRGTAFVIPRLVSDDSTRRPCLDDVPDGGASMAQILGCEREAPLCTWDELREMQASGVISVQSHTSRHDLVHVGSRIRDFIHPRLDANFFGNVNVPLVRQGGFDQVDRPLALGRPIYEALPRMAGRPRYEDDETLRELCERLVAAAGGRSFFERPGWRRELASEARRVRRRRGERGTYESPREYATALDDDLRESRETIEGRLGSSCRHLCYPWYYGSELAVESSRRAGFATNFWGSKHAPNANLLGRDPYHLPRIDSRYLRRLPGPCRAPLREILETHFDRAFAGKLRRRRASTLGDGLAL